MQPLERKAAIAAYKARPPAFGVFAVIREATGDVWVGKSRHLDTEMNGLWFALSLGRSPYRSLQAAWTAHGQTAFRFEELERLREDFPKLTLMDELKKRQALWRVRLKAEAL